MISKDSKTNFARLKERILQQNGKEYWRSVEEFVDAPEFEEFVKYEYPAHAEEWDNSLSRRNFIKVMGASLALAGLSGCVIQPSEKIVPYVTQPEDIIPGKPLFFATAITLGGIANGVLARSNEGRPTKLEGNPEHPGSLGATDVLTQAALLDLYDPDRSKEITYRGEPKTWQLLMTELRAKVDENRRDGGAGIRFLTETVTSPTLTAQFAQLKTELPNAKWHQYEPVNRDNATAGAKMAFGSAVNTVYKFDQAERILTLDADIFSGFNVRYIKDFSKGRTYSDEKKNINRLYAIETTMTLTGAKADHRLAVKPSQMSELAKSIAGKLGVAGASSTAKFDEKTTKWIEAMAKDLKAHAGKSIVVAGDNQSPMVHALAHAMNETLGNVGKTLSYTEPLEANAETLQIESLRELIKDIDGGAVKMLIILGGNPVYNTPADLKLNEERLNKIPLRVHLGRYRDETAELCQWHIGEKHFLEMWSDARAFDGTVSIVQPLIEPLYGGKNAHEIVQLFFKENYEKKDYDILREYWQKQSLNMAAKTATVGTTSETKPEEKAEVKTTTSPTPAVVSTPTAQPATAPTVATGGKSFDENWRKIVHDGTVPNSEAKAKEVKVNGAFMSQPETKPAGGGALEFSILPDPSVYDGRFTNNGWLQELPNPLTKITWENVALVSPKTAERLGLNRGNDSRELSGGERPTAFVNSKGGNMFSDLVTVTYQGGKLENVPVWIAPGQPDDVVTLYLGYGRKKAGRVGTGLGYNAYEIRKSDALYFGSGEVAKNGGQATIASTQIHFNMEGRELLNTWEVENVEELSAKLKKKEDKEAGYDISMYPSEEFQKSYDTYHRWGMTIDLNSCVGCNACVIACQSENNIPIVGKEQVERSREMHWMRVDAYYKGDLENPQGPSFQPVLCQQCEQAPCEVVCPVHATVHSAEGLNDMVYNRCIGTRYCSNNCPYKVRRFNFFLYQDWDTPQYKLMRNPEVSIRSRGVMEKCTYCTQRISSARIEAEKDGRKVRDGEVLTACQSVCPADAIVFGDMNDKSSKVAQSKADKRNYTLLNELNTVPRTTYLAGLKNQNKEMPDYVAPKKEEEKKSEGGH